MEGPSRHCRELGCVCQTDVEVSLTLVSSLLSASIRRMTSLAGSEPLLRENPASKGVRCPVSVDDARRLTV